LSKDKKIKIIGNVMNCSLMMEYISDINFELTMKNRFLKIDFIYYKK